MEIRRHRHERLVCISSLTSFSSPAAHSITRYGTYSVSEALNAGLDLEMPGPPRWRTPMLVQHSLSAAKLSLPTLTERAAHMLRFVQKLAARNPDVVYGDGKERTRDSPEARAFCRKLAAEGMVLLRNEEGLLPLRTSEGKTLKVAVVGPNAKGYVISGGGSAALKASYVVTPYQGLEEGKPDGVELSYHVGCYGKPPTRSWRLLGC